MSTGLTISYKFKADTCDEERARSLVHKLRRRALDPPFLEVGEVRGFGEGEIDIKNRPRIIPTAGNSFNRSCVTNTKAKQTSGTSSLR